MDVSSDSRMSLSKQIRVLLTVSLIGFVILLGLALHLVEKVKVNGALFAEMTRGKDLLADVLPPPSYLVELHHLGLALVVQGQGPKSNERMREIKSMVDTFEARHAYWLKSPLTPELKVREQVVYETGRTFIDAFQKAFAAGGPMQDQALARSHFTEILDPLFQTHQAAVRGLVQEVTQYNDAVARHSKNQELSGKGLLIGFFVCICLLLVSWGILVSRRVVEQREVEAKRLESEAQYRFALNAARMGTWEWNIVKNEVRWSEGVSPLFGLAEGEFEGTYEGYLKLVHPDDRAMVERTISRTLGGNTATYHIEHRVRLPNGQESWLEGNGQLYRDDEGSPKCLRGMVTDITARKNLEAERAALEAKLRHSQRMEAVGKLAGGVAHDFNNILTGIIGYSEIALEKLSHHPAEKGLREILSAAERAAKLTKQLLAFSRKQVMQPEVLDVVSVVKNLQGMLERLLGNSHKLIVESVGELPAIKADRGQIEQVILNLVVNARDAMPEGGAIIISAQRVERAQVQASWGHLESDGKVLMLAVSDQGTGIAPEVKSSLFQPYFTTKAEGKGTGLGLSTVYGIVQQSGGAIGLDSEVGKGSTFKIYLMGLEGPAQEAEHEKKPVVRRRITHHGTILVAEDDLQIGDVVKQGLESRGFKVLLVNEASSALRIIRDYQGPLDLLLTDVMMPGMNGRMLAEEAVAMRPQMKVLFMSGFAADESLHVTIAKLKADVILKPFSPESLHQKMCDVMQIESEVVTKAG